MESKIPAIKWKMILRDILKHWPIWTLSLVVYLFIVFLVNAIARGFLSTTTRYEVSITIIDSLIETTKFISFLMGLACAWASFGFLGKKKKDFFYAALPFNRLGLFVHRFIFGLLMCMLPVVVMFFIELFQILILSGNFEILFMLEWLAMAFVSYLFWYSFAVLFAVVCGRIMMAGFCYFMFAFIGMFLKFFIEILNEVCYIGTNFGYGSGSSILGILSPVEYMFQIGVDYQFEYEMSTGKVNKLFVEGATEKILVFLFAGIVLSVVSYLLFSRRKEERTGDNVVFGGMKYVFCWVLSFVGTITLGVFIYGLTFYKYNEIAHRAFDRICVVIILAFTGYFVYIISCMIVEKRLKVFKTHSIKAVIFALAVSLIGVGYLHDLFNIEGYMPDTEDVAYINIINYKSISKLFKNEPKTRSITLKDKKDIGLIRGLHEIVVDHIDEAGEKYYILSDQDYYHISISYNLKNGTTVSRQYNIYDGSDLDMAIKRYLDEHFEEIEYSSQNNKTEVPEYDDYYEYYDFDVQTSDMG